MIRKQLSADGFHSEPNFRWRGGEISRLEGFTDAVFAFAVTLLVVSLEVPKTYDELMESLHGFAAFGLCFAALTRVWLQHYRYFRRYGLQDTWSIFLNCVLLFFVLFYVYPLKFLIVGIFQGNLSAGREDQVRSLLTVFGLGFAAVHIVFLMLYLHALRLQQTLALTAIERLRTLQGVINNAVITLVGLLSVGASWILPLGTLQYAGYLYLVLPICFMLVRRQFDRHERRLLQAA
jgi:uncharacterized membrane protein